MDKPYKIHFASSIEKEISSSALGANILLENENTVRLTDFGISKILTTPTTNTYGIGTFRWMAPEIINDTPYGFEVDVWLVFLIC